MIDSPRRWFESETVIPIKLEWDASILAKLQEAAEVMRHWGDHVAMALAEVDAWDDED